MFSEIKLPNFPSQSKIVWTGFATVLVNLLVMFGLIPEALGPATIEAFNAIAAALMVFFRAFKTIPTEDLKTLKTLQKQGKL